MSLPSSKEFFSWIKAIARIWHSPYGLVAAIFLATYLFPNCTRTFFDNVIADYPKQAVLLKNSQYFLFGLMYASITILWFINRRLPRFSKNEIGVLFCPLVNEKSAEVSKRLKNSLHRELKNFGLNFKIKNLPSNHKILDAQKAHKILKLSNAYLIIWGLLETGNIKEKNATGFPTISFTFQMPALPQQLIPYYFADLSFGLVGKQWHVDSGNDFFGVELLSKKITEASLNIIGKLLLTHEDYNTAIKVLTSLLNDFLSSPSYEENTLLKAFKRSVIVALSFAYFGKSRKLYYAELYPEIDHGVDEKKLLSCFKTVTKAIDLFEKEGRYYLLRSIFYFFLEKFPEAIDDVAKAKLYYPRISGAANLSGAFIYFFKGEEEDIRRGIKWYKKALQKELLLKTVREVIYFISSILKKYPEKIQLHLSLGILHKDWLDSSIARKEFKMFINKAKKQKKYGEFVYFANKQLKKIKG